MTAHVPPGMAAKAFAVTVEPAGGMPWPTGPKVLVGRREPRRVTARSPVNSGCMPSSTSPGTNSASGPGSAIREAFLKFFESKGHRRVHSSSLVPANDPTLLFTNAGMNQFKDVFLGLERRDYSRATTSQKCVRAGGKHNDLENVGFTRRHHTFFEMLGNFSFGDYFKKDAIAYAWELVTSPEWFGIPKDRLYVTIFKGENGVPRDEEAYKLWLGQGVPAERIGEYGMKDNFWQMGDTGPCGPCSEIFYDMGIEAAETPGVDKPFGQDEARYVEIWNLVFMQFDRNAQGELNLLPKPSIDTGMGLERVAAVLEGVASNFETDLFTPLIERAYAFVMIASDKQEPSEPIGGGFAAYSRIIADHARAATFLIADGVLPSNEGRGYVLRKIIRRAIRHGRIHGAKRPFFFLMVPEIVKIMGDAYPELRNARERVGRVLLEEEERFLRTIELGSEKLEQGITAAVDRAASEAGFGPMNGEPVEPLVLRSLNVTHLKSRGVTPKLDGRAAFHLYETYGLPLDFMMDAARDAGIHFDLEGFEQARAEEQARARASWKGGTKQSASPAFRDLPKTTFEGYRQLRVDGAEVLAIVKDGQGVPAAQRWRCRRDCAGSDQLLCRLRRADWRYGLADVGRSQLRGGRRERVHQAGAGRVCASGDFAAGNQAWRPRRYRRRCQFPQRDAAQSYGDASAARGAARGAGHARQAGGVAGGTEPAAVRLLAFRGHR